MSVGICDSNEGALDGRLDWGVEKERRFTKEVATVMQECTAQGKEDLGNGTAFTSVQDGSKNMREDIRNATALLLILGMKNKKLERHKINSHMLRVYF